MRLARLTPLASLALGEGSPARPVTMSRGRLVASRVATNEVVADPNSYALRRAKTTNLLRGRVMDVRLRVVAFGGVWH
jgi:hypothetical protein